MYARRASFQTLHNNSNSNSSAVAGGSRRSGGNGGGGGGAGRTRSESRPGAGRAGAAGGVSAAYAYFMETGRALNGTLDLEHGSAGSEGVWRKFGRRSPSCSALRLWWHRLLHAPARAAALLALLALFAFLALDFSRDHLLPGAAHGGALGGFGGRGRQLQHNYRNADYFRAHRPFGPLPFGVVTDMDRLSARREQGTWISYFRRGELYYNGNGGGGGDGDADVADDNSDSNWSVRWRDDGAGATLDTRIAEDSRGMELSELIMWRNHLLTPCDRTGIVYEILDARGASPHAAPRYALASGDGERAKGFKAEWMTVQHNALLIGGHGREMTAGRDGTHVTGYDPLWVKRVAPEADEHVQHMNWTRKFEQLRAASGTGFPGYLEHEAAAWSERRREWLFLPRRFSRAAYDEVQNEYRGWNKLLLADDTFTRVRVVQLDVEVTPEKGFSSVKFVPFTGDKIAAALRTVEHEGDGVYRSYMTVFRVDDGLVLMRDVFVGDAKYEGLEFL